MGKYIVTSKNRDKKIIAIKEGGLYYLIGTAQKRNRWTQDMGRSRSVVQWDVLLYANTYGPRLSDPYTYRFGEINYLEHRYLTEDAEKIFGMYKDELLTAKNISGLKELVGDE